MGAAESVIRNVDKRSSRREHRSLFQKAISDFQHEHDNEIHKKDCESLLKIENQCKSTCVFVRKRPLFEHELNSGEFDVVTTGLTNLVIHEARMHPDMCRLQMLHHRFNFDQVFDESSTNNDIYEAVGSPMVHCALNGGYATILMFGQTGSGKTYTMSAIYTKAAAQIFQILDTENGRFDDPGRIKVSFLELAGSLCSDMLNEGNSLKLVTGADGYTHAYPAVEVECPDAESLKAIIAHATALRATEATGVHSHSSRSHAICRIYISRRNVTDKENFLEGVLTLVDLAGTEMRIDSEKHDAARRRESSQINTSLMALKDCIRVLANPGGDGAYIPFRRSNLTSLLRASFTAEGAMTAVISTVSPSSKDTEHSLSTLRNACLMDGHTSEEGIQNENISKVDIGAIDVTAMGRKKRAQKKMEVQNSDTPEARIAADAALKVVSISPADALAARQKWLRRAEKRSIVQLPKEAREALLVGRKDLSIEGCSSTDRLKKTLNLSTAKKLGRHSVDSFARVKKELNFEPEAENIAETEKIDLIIREEQPNAKSSEGKEKIVLPRIPSTSSSSSSKTLTKSSLIKKQLSKDKIPNGNRQHLTKIPLNEKSNSKVAPPCGSFSDRDGVAKSSKAEDETTAVTSIGKPKSARSSYEKSSISDLENVLREGGMSPEAAYGIKKKIAILKANEHRAELKRCIAEGKVREKRSVRSNADSIALPLNFGSERKMHVTAADRAKMHISEARKREEEKAAAAREKSEMAYREAERLWHQMNAPEINNEMQKLHESKKRADTHRIGASAAPFATDFNWKHVDGLNNN